MHAIAVDAPGEWAKVAGLAFLAYIRDTWMPKAMWESWSRKGQIDGASRMGVTVDEVLPTTNHLESFNGSLKKSHLPEVQHSGARLRFDILIFHLTGNILPRVYAHHRMLIGYGAWKVERFRNAAGGADLSRIQRSSISLSNPQHSVPQQSSRPLAWYSPDPARDGEAEGILCRQLLRPIVASRPFELWAQCQSSSSISALSSVPSPIYWLTIYPSGPATCTCPDWMFQGGACKHLRAFKQLIQSWQTSGHLPCGFTFPTSRDNTEHLLHHACQWYGDCYAEFVTLPPSPVDIPSESGNSSWLDSSGGLPARPPHLPLTETPKAILLPPRGVEDSSGSLEQELQWQEIMTDESISARTAELTVWTFTASFQSNIF